MQNENTPTEGQNSDKLEAESALRGAACSDSSLPSPQWSDYQTELLPGDLVETEFGRAVITEAHQSQGADTYAVWHLPGWKWRRELWGWSPAKVAWYSLDELRLLEKGTASNFRPNGKDDPR